MRKDVRAACVGHHEIVLVPVIRSSRPDITQVCRGGSVDDTIDAELWPGLGNVLEEPSSAVKQHRCERDLQLVDQVAIQELLDDIGAPGNTDVAVARGIPCEREGALRAVGDEVEHRAARARPGFSGECVST